jgi:hypothetical protein
VGYLPLDPKRREGECPPKHMEGEDMLSMPRKWEEMPPSVKTAIISLLVGWAAHYLFYFGFIAEDQTERVTYLQLGVGIGICYCVATIRKWARRLCIFFNIVMVPMYFLFAIAFAQGGKIGLFALTAFTALAFAFSLYSLLKKETAQFFAPPGKETDQEGDESAHGPR